MKLFIIVVLFIIIVLLALLIYVITGMTDEKCLSAAEKAECNHMPNSVGVCIYCSQNCVE